MANDDSDSSAEPQSTEEDVPVNSDPEIIGYTVQIGVNLLQAYGWFFVFGIVILAFLWSKFQPWISKLRQHIASTQQHSLYDADAETIQARSAALEVARRRLQEQHDAAAAQFAERKKQEEEMMRQKKIEDWENHLQGKGYRSKYKPSDEDGGVDQSATNSLKRSAKPRLRDPSLRYGDDESGSSSTTRWRPSRRGPSTGGG